MPPRGVKQKEHGYTQQQLSDILDKGIKLYEKSHSIAFHPILKKLCSFTETNWNYYKNVKKWKCVIEKLNILKDMQEQKVIEATAVGSCNAAFGIFFLKSRCGWIEEQHKQMVAIHQKRLDNEIGKKVAPTQDINVEFIEDEEDDEVDESKV